MLKLEDLSVVTSARDKRGGQHTGQEPVVVTVTHLPTGISASVCQRSQLKARNIACDMILSALTHPDFR